MPERSALRFPHAIAAVVQMLRLSVDAETTRNVAEAVALMDDRDRWLEDNLARLDPSSGDGSGASRTGIPPGALMDWAGIDAPEGYLACDGSEVGRADYPDLFTAIGNRWGAGDGSTTFNLPDFRGRTAIGAGAGAGLTNRTVGQRGGEEAHSLTANENGQHNHSGVVSSLTFANLWASGGSTGVNGQGGTGNTNVSGSGAAHNNMQPFAVVLKIIKT